MKIRDLRTDRPLTEAPGGIEWLPYAIWSLYEMLRIHASMFYMTATLLEQIKNSFRLEQSESVVDEKQRTDLLKRLNLAKSYCVQLSLPVTQKLVERLIGIASKEGCTFGDFTERFSELVHRFADELSDRLVFHVQSENQKYFDGSLKEMGGTVTNNFTSTIYDIEEAGKCLALGRGTACVFHLMRIMEAGLRSLAKSLNDPTLDPKKNPNWETMLRKCDEELRKPLAQRSDEWKVDDAFFSRATANLRSVKDAWRNPTMHVEQKYTLEEARDIFYTVGIFMRHIATKLKE